MAGLPLEVELAGIRVVLEYFGKGDSARPRALRQAIERLSLDSAMFSQTRTPWGQPRLRRKNARTATVRAPLISFADERDLGVLAALSSARIVGLGVDIVDTHRLLQTVSAPCRLRRFLSRMGQHGTGPYPLADLSLTDSRHHIAALFSGREAVAKAMGTGLRLGLGMGHARSIPMSEIQLRFASGRFQAELHGSARQRMSTLRVEKVELSMALADDYLLAVAVLVRRERRNPDTSPAVVPV